jgi:lipopolysaccharide transport system ATP-binding protein
MSTVINVENISKQYRLGSVGTGSLVHDLNRTWQRIRGKEDPYLKIGETNDRTQMGASDYVWALQDINFEVKQGEVMGIIGRNGAGKSTLLKILSRTTTPTTGKININGRVASLLEVGTGFHPELSGRENIFLNGAILGMTRHEIKSKFDEIVDFAGVERYIDTPVKRYSSGMYVRLAFGVAAHLEPEILIVDEVLAVGDAEFQKKALGKMKDVSSKDGRTVLFVSHNMEAIQNLCDRAILLKNGRVNSSGLTVDVIKSYMNVYNESKTEVKYALNEAPGNSLVKLLRAKVSHKQEQVLFKMKDPLFFEFELLVTSKDFLQLDITYHLTDERSILVYEGTTFYDFNKKFSDGKFIASCNFPGGVLNEGNYTISKLLVVQNKGNIVASFEEVISFDILPEKKEGFIGWTGKKQGVIKPSNVHWTLEGESIF